MFFLFLLSFLFSYKNIEYLNNKIYKDISIYKEEIASLLGKPFFETNTVSYYAFEKSKNKFQIIKFQFDNYNRLTSRDDYYISNIIIPLLPNDIQPIIKPNNFDRIKNEGFLWMETELNNPNSIENKNNYQDILKKYNLFKR